MKPIHEIKAAIPKCLLCNVYMECIQCELQLYKLFVSLHVCLEEQCISHACFIHI